MRKLLFFDDVHVDRLDPITTMRAAADIRCGIHRIAKKWRLLMQVNDAEYDVRPHLKPLYKSIISTIIDIICINGRWLPSVDAVREIKKLKMGEGLSRDGFFWPAVLMKIGCSGYKIIGFQT
jgi:hypothetical protein